jgi:hypothetical protein
MVLSIASGPYSVEQLRANEQHAWRGQPGDPDRIPPSESTMQQLMALLLDEISLPRKGAGPPAIAWSPIGQSGRLASHVVAVSHLFDSDP